MGCALLLRGKALDDVGLFDERFFMYVDEPDLCRRLAEAGWETHYVPDVSVVHYVSQFSANVPERRIVEHWRSRRKHWAKHHSPLGARMAALLTGLQYAIRSALVPLLLLLPKGRRPPRVTPVFGAALRLHVRNAWFGETGPGLAELADEWNERKRRPTPAEAAQDRTSAGSGGMA
jgi:GT2 family glycosyltransferase